MSNSNETNICGSTETESGEPCQRPAGWGTDHNGEGRCDDHPGRGAPKGNQNAVGNDGGAPPANQNASVHGLYSDHSNYYSDLDDAHQRFVDFHYWGFLNDAPFDDTSSKAGVLFEIAVNHHKRLSADGELSTDGLTVTEEDIAPNGERTTSTREHSLNIVYDRLARTDIRRLKELDVLDSPDSRQANALEGGVDLHLSDDDKSALEAAFNTES